MGKKLKMQKVKRYRSDKKSHGRIKKKGRKINIRKWKGYR